jgi:DNA (cytosine-5)-methyltransferase 1
VGDDVKPKMLVYFCCQGGACKGYEDAGFDVTPIDLHPQPKHYAPHKVIVADAIAHLAELIDTGTIRQYAAIGGSPPCQLYSLTWRIRTNDHPDLIGPFRELCLASGLPYVIENVIGAPLKDPIQLCGGMFGLRTHRHRLFESNIDLADPGPCPAPQKKTIKMGRPLNDGDWYHAVGNFCSVDYVRTDMRVPWMNRDGIRECIPPVYAEHIGRQLLAHLAAA